MFVGSLLKVSELKADAKVIAVIAKVSGHERLD